MRTRIGIATAACVWASVSGGEARGQHAGDLLLRAREGRVEVGAFDGASTVFESRVFTSEFGDLGFPDRTADPGVNSAAGDFVSNAAVDVRIRRAARKWSETSRNFCERSSERIEVRKGTRTISTPTEDPPGLSGAAITLGFTDALDGLIHQHPAYWIVRDAGDVRDGVYLLECQIEATGLQPSRGVWIVFSQNATSEEHDRATEFAVKTLERGSGNLCRDAADFDDDGSVAVADIFAFLNAWFTEFGTSGASGLQADFDGDGSVSVGDIFSFLGRWFSSF